MPVANLLVDGVVGYQILSFMDGHSGFNQIFINKKDTYQTSFRCLGLIGMFEWMVMPFGLKNTRATYQWAMNYTFHEMIRKLMEVYINNIVMKSQDFNNQSLI